MAETKSDEVKPMHWAYEYRDGIRFGTGGRQINGGAPIRAIGLYTQEQVDALLADAKIVEQRVAQTAEGILSIIKGSRMVGQSPIGRLHQVGWNAAVSLISDRVRAIIADSNWLSKRDVERERAARGGEVSDGIR